MQEELIKWAIHNKFRIFDFTIGNESYKKIWTNDVIKIFFHIKLNFNQRAFIYYGLQFFKINQTKQILACKILYGSLTSSQQKRPQMNIALTLHRVVKSEKYRLNHEDITVDKLDYLLRKIQNSTFAIEDLNKNNQNKSNFLLTFDDGFSSDFEIVLPMLKLMKINAVFFIVTSSIGKKGYLNEEQIVNLSKTGMTVGSHSVNHFDMTSLNKKNRMYELKNSKKN